MTQKRNITNRNPIFILIVAYKGQGLTGSCVLDYALRWRVAHERMLDVSENDSPRRVLRVRRRDCVPSVELRRRLCLTSIPALFVQRRLRRFGHAARRPNGELIKDLPLPTQPRTWRRRTGGPLKTWATTIKTDLEPLSGPRVFGYARCRNDRVNVSSELA